MADVLRYFPDRTSEREAATVDALRDLLAMAVGHEVRNARRR